MDKAIVSIAAVVLVGFLLLLAICLGTIFGAVAGWAVGWLFDETSAKVLAYIGVEGFAMWEIGAALGFVGGFFRGSSSSSSSD